MSIPRLNKTKARAVLKERGWTQADLARKAGLDEAQVSRVFNGLRPSENVVIRLEALLGQQIWRKR